jgi:hypothetical protein
MDLSTIIQVAIGMFFVWIVLAIITSQIQEWIASIFAWRAAMLEDTVLTMLNDPALKERLYKHPLIQGLHTNNGKRRPAGIPPDKFALVLLDEVLDCGPMIQDAKAGVVGAKTAFEQLKSNVESLKIADANTGLKNFATSLDTLLIGIEDKADDATHAITQARQRVESWFNNSMERLGGAYRRRVQIVGLIVGILVSAILNADSNAIVTALWKDPILRQAVVAQANQMQAPTAAAATPASGTIELPQPAATPAPNAEEPPQSPDVQKIINTANQLNITSLPIGWSRRTLPDDPWGWFGKVLGILISGMAAAQGAPYWFDLMRKLVSRNAPAESPKPAG